MTYELLQLSTTLCCAYLLSTQHHTHNKISLLPLCNCILYIIKDKTLGMKQLISPTVTHECGKDTDTELFYDICSSYLQLCSYICKASFPHGTYTDSALPVLVNVITSTIHKYENSQKVI